MMPKMNSAVFGMLGVFMFFAAFTPLMAQEGEVKVSIEQVPAAVKAAILKEVGQGRLVDIGVFTRGGTKTYEIEMVQDGKEFDVLFAADGKVLKKTFEGYKKGKGSEEEGDEEGDEEKEDGEDEGKPAQKPEATTLEKKVTIDKVPPVVRKAILETVGEGRLVDIGVFGDGEKSLYEIEMITDDKEFDVLFSTDGKIVRRTFEGVKKKGSREKDTPRTDVVVFQDTFDLETRELVPTGRNRYFILEPGYQLVLEGKEGDENVRLEVIVLDETRKIGNIVTRVVEERESVDGALIEISRNFFAMCKETRSIFYFGEEVDIYKDGKIVAHEGAWLHGRNGARAGMMMPGEPMIGAGYYQEVAPQVALDRARIVDLNVSLETPAGFFRKCLKCREENPLDKEKEFKIHAPGIGLIQDEDLLLVKFGFVK